MKESYLVVYVKETIFKFTLFSLNLSHCSLACSKIVKLDIL